MELDSSWTTSDSVLMQLENHFFVIKVTGNDKILLCYPENCIITLYEKGDSYASLQS